VVDPSLLRQAADLGVTIAFADLDGAEGLWVPEERTVLVNRGLSDAQVARVIEHELTHVAIDDQHADLDAGREVLLGRPPAGRTGPAAMALAGVSILAVVGGVAFGIDRLATGDRGEQVVGPPKPGLTAEESGAPRPTTTVIRTQDSQGRVILVTIGVTPSPRPDRISASTLAPTPTPSGRPASVPASTVPGTSAAPPKPTPTELAPGPTSATPAPTIPEPTVPEPTTPSPAPSTDVLDPGGGDGGGDPGDEAGGLDTDTGTESMAGTGTAGGSESADPVITTGN
jgi:hypothetical protein